MTRRVVIMVAGLVGLYLAMLVLFALWDVVP